MFSKEELTMILQLIAVVQIQCKDAKVVSDLQSKIQGIINEPEKKNDNLIIKEMATGDI
jgi:hypothetical protein